MRCAICLSGNISYKMCCNMYIHRKCQKQWSKNCIICRKEIKYIKTKKKYVYVPPEPELTREELQEQIALMQEIERRNIIIRDEINTLVDRTNTVHVVTSFFENI